MKRYFLPLLLATACVGGYASKGWGMMGKNDDLKQGLSNSMKNLGIFLNQNAKPSLTPQYPLTGDALKNALKDLAEKLSIDTIPLLPWQREFILTFDQLNKKPEGENFVKESYAYVKAPHDISNPCFSFSEEKKGIWQDFIFYKFDGVETMHNQIARDIKNDFCSLSPINPLNFSKLKDVTTFMVDQKKLLQGTLGLWKLRDQIYFLRNKSFEYNSNFLLPEKNLYNKCKILQQNIISAFAALFDFLGTDFSQPEWDNHTLSNWVEYCDEYLNAFDNLVVENAQKKDFSGYLKLLEIRTDMDLEKNLRGKQQTNQAIWELLMASTLESYKEAQAHEKIIKLFQDGHVPLTKKRIPFFIEALKNHPKKNFTFVVYNLLQNPSLKNQTLAFLNDPAKPSVYTGTDWDLYLKIIKENDFLQKPPAKKGQPQQPSKFEQDLKLQKDLDAPYSQDTLFQIAFILEQQKKTKEALNLYTHLASQGSLEATLRLYILKLNKGNLKEAEFNQTIEGLQKALLQKPDPEGAWVLSQAFLDLDNDLESIEWLLKAADLGYPEAVALLKQKAAEKKTETVLIVSPDLEKVEAIKSTQQTSKPIEEHKEPEHEIINFHEMIPDKKEKNPEPDAISVAPSHVTGVTQSSVTKLKKLLLQQILGIKNWHEIEAYDPETQGKIERYHRALEKALEEREARKAAQAKLKAQQEHPDFIQSVTIAKDLVDTLKKTPKEMSRKDVWKELTCLQELGAQCGIEVMLPTNNHVHKFSFKNTVIENGLEEGEFDAQENPNSQEEKKEDKKSNTKKKKDDDNGMASAHTKHSKNFKTLDFGFKNRLVEILKKIYRLEK